MVGSARMSVALVKQVREGLSVGQAARMERARSALNFLTDLSAHPDVEETDRSFVLAQLHMAGGWIRWAVTGFAH